MKKPVINYIVKPFVSFWKGFIAKSEIIGYNRAAAHLAKLGYQKEAKNCKMYMQQKQLH